MSWFSPRKIKNIETMWPPSTTSVIRELRMVIDGYRVVLAECPFCWALTLKGKFMDHCAEAHEVEGRFK